MKDWIGNKKSTYITLGASNHTDKDREEHDYYATDPIAIDKLLEHHAISSHIWECACGQMHLAKRLQDNIRVKDLYASDLVVRPNDCGIECHQLDFLKATREDVPYQCCDIITNPPYKYAMEFVLKSLELLRDGYECCMFLKLQFLEGKKRYKELFSKYPPKKVLVFSERVLCAKNAEFDNMRAGGGSAVAYAWFIWEKGYLGSTFVGWI